MPSGFQIKSRRGGWSSVSCRTTDKDFRARKKMAGGSNFDYLSLKDKILMGK